MRIAVDAMGGDYAPGEIVKGVLVAVNKWGINIILVGHETLLRKELSRASYPAENVEILNAQEVIEMHEQPAKAVRKKKQASIVVATKLVKEGKAAAVVSAGNTGAQMAASLFELKRLPGVNRPGIATIIPSPQGTRIFIDSGANVDCDPVDLLQFSRLGTAYARHVLKIDKPKVGLLNIGAESTKGNETVIQAYQLMEQDQKLNFFGNVEGRDFFTADVDVIVCDGFVGNIVLKLTEGLTSTLFSMIKEEFSRNYLRKLGGLFVSSGFKEIARSMDYTEYGGAPLLGVQGISVICHGSSRAKAISNAIRFAKEAAESRFLEAVRTE